MAQGVDGRTIFADDRDREIFLSILRDETRKRSAEVLAYCLMNNQFHLVLKIGEVPLSSVMHRLLTAYATGHNKRRERRGHLFQARYKALICTGDAALGRIIRYIRLCPVRAGLVSRPEEWAWSDGGRSDDPDAEVPKDFDPWLRSVDSSRAVTLREITDDISLRTGLSLAAILSRTRTARVVAAKRVFASTALANGYSMTAIAKWLGLSVAAVSLGFQRSKLKVQAWHQA